jgi:3-dehydroquinate dehydratase type II
MRKPAERNIILIGMPGAGKTTVGRIVAKSLGREFFDSDAEIERREGMTCAQIFASRGEGYFRAVEREVVSELVRGRGLVLALGGGAPVMCGDLLQKNSVVVWLERALEEIASSLGDNTRPLSRSIEDLRRQYAERAEVYEACAHILIENTGAATDAAAAVLETARPHLKARILVINGANLNLLGSREPEVYGSQTQEDLIDLIARSSAELGIAADYFQSNHEGAIIDAIQETLDEFDGIVINPGAYTHYSYAIHDALKSVPAPAVEVHISNVHTREEFRHKSVTAPACAGQIVGLGFYGYVAAMDFLAREVGE